MAIDFDEIITGHLWVGSFVREGDLAQLRRMGITDIVNLQTDEDMEHCGASPESLADACRPMGILVHRFAINDFDKQDLARCLAGAVELINGLLSAPTAKVYLHCTAGINRSPTVAAAYLIRSLGLPARDAANHLTSRRDCDPAVDVLEGYAAALRSDPSGRGTRRT